MDKTPGQVAAETFLNVDIEWKRGGTHAEMWERTAAAVIAHVRPKIEAEARAAAVEQFMTAVCNNSTLPMSVCMAVSNAVKDLSDLPLTHVCVPVDLLDTLSSEEGAEQKDINEARRIVEAARPK